MPSCKSGVLENVWSVYGFGSSELSSHFFLFSLEQGAGRAARVSIPVSGNCYLSATRDMPRSRLLVFQFWLRYTGKRSAYHG